MSWATRILIIAVLVGAAMWAAFEEGAEHANARRDAAQLQAERVAALAYEKRVKAGDQAVAQLMADKAAQQASYTTLERKFNDARKANTLLARSATPTPAAPAEECAVVVAAGDPSLSQRAVWMWNSALAGRDVPAGACGAADPTSPACAADAGIGLEEAWDNHAENARLCAEDRLQHQRLIDFIQKREIGQ